MAERTKPYEEARKDAEAFFRGDSFRSEVFLSRYALRALDGNWIETTPDRTWDRVSRAMARPEKDRAPVGVCTFCEAPAVENPLAEIQSM